MIVAVSVVKGGGGGLAAVEARRVTPNAAPGVAGAIVLLRDGAAAVNVRIDGATVIFDEHLGAAPRSWRAELAPALAERLRESRPTLPP